ncbi:MAG: sigma-70 family RNA polymerase sigma factor [Deltaproteobacteria bacterium]|nr:sigma-70 family RNA polymerase sigma factor [Deltaproteobacteria bacterium]
MEHRKGGILQIGAEMVAQLRQGNSDTRQRFWEESFDAVLAICSRILGSGPQSIDVTTDLLNDFLFHYVQNLKNPHGAWSYLKLMAIRRAVRERQRMMTGEPFDDQQMDYPGGEMDDVETTVLLPKLNQCLALLTPKAQSTVRLKYRQGMSNEQIGHVVGGSKQYIGRLLTQSLAALRECLQRKAVANG